MPTKSFSLQIGSLSFNKKSISYILFGVFLLGVLMGVLSITYIDNPGLSISDTIILFLGAVIPLVIIVKGCRRATVIKGSTR